MSINSEEKDVKKVGVRVSSEPCKPTTSFCGSPTHFVRGKRHSVRSAVVPIRLTPTEYEAIRAIAKSVGLSLSAFIRAASLKRRLPPSSAPEVNRWTYEELARIGNNLNQLMRAVHARVVDCVDEALLRQLRDHVRVLALEVLGAEARGRDA